MEETEKGEWFQEEEEEEVVVVEEEEEDDDDDDVKELVEDATLLVVSMEFRVVLDLDIEGDGFELEEEEGLTNQPRTAITCISPIIMGGMDDEVDGEDVEREEDPEDDDVYSKTDFDASSNCSLPCRLLPMVVF